MIPRSFIQQLVSRCDIEDVISSYVVLKRAGRNVKGLCPFHSEKTPSFTVYPDTQSFYCFGCGAGGDVISFLMRAENLDYPEAVRLLAKRVGMEVPEDGQEDGSQLKARILQINREAALFFHRCLLSPAGRAGYEYLHGKRRLSDKTITGYGLGYAPDGWTHLTDYLRKQGYTDEELCAAAVAVKGRNGRIYDQFRNRVMFPIIDLRGSVIAFGGRVLDDSKPKYLNSPDTPVFKKSRNLFSLNFAKKETGNRLILAEGYMDVISIYAHGFHNVVATLGTSLTEEQARLMSKYAREIIIAYDSDGAGQTATHRAVNLLSEAGLTARVLHMEGAKDPDEYLQKFGATRFQMLLDGASDVITHELGSLKQRCDLESPEGKIEYLKQAVNILSDIQNPLERDVYAGMISRETGVLPETVASQIRSLIQKKHQWKEKKEWREIETGKASFLDKLNTEKARFRKEAAAEEGIIAFLFQNPDGYAPLQDRLSPEGFVTAYNRKVLLAMLRLHGAGEEVSVSSLASELSPEEIRGVAAILARHHDSILTKEMFEDYIDILLAHKDRPERETLREWSPEDIEAYRQKLRGKKQ